MRLERVGRDMSEVGRSRLLRPESPRIRRGILDTATTRLAVERDNRSVFGRRLFWVAIASLVGVAACTTQVVGANPRATTTWELLQPRAMAATANGSLYVYDAIHDQVFLRNPGGELRLIAGNGRSGTNGDGKPAVDAELESVAAMALGNNGALYLVSGERIRAISPGGTITTVAGGGTEQPVSGAVATEVSLKSPIGIAISPSGALYLAVEWQSAVYRLSGDHLEQVLGPSSFLGADPLWPEDDSMNVDALAFDRSGNLYLGGTDPYAVFVLPIQGRLHSIGALRGEAPDALASSRSGSVFDAGNLSLMSFSSSSTSGNSSGGRVVFNYSLAGILPGHQYLAGAGVAALPDGAAIIDGNVFGAPGDCHHAVIIEIATAGRAQVLDNWQPNKSGPSC